MVRDGFYYGAGLLAAAAVVWWVAGWLWAGLPLALAGFFLWFFRDPERVVPDAAGAVVSAADGKVTDILRVEVDGRPRTRISIFLSVFSVHVNRSPIAGVVRAIEYRRGKFLNAMGARSAEENEQSIVTVEGDGQTVIFKQIAGILARRIVCNLKVGDRVDRGQRMGLIKFGSRVDVILSPEAAIQVKIGDHVQGGSSILALFPVREEAASVLSDQGRAKGGD